MTLSRASQGRMERIRYLQRIIDEMRQLPDEGYPRKEEALAWMEQQQSQLVTRSMAAWALLTVFEATQKQVNRTNDPV